MVAIDNNAASSVGNLIRMQYAQSSSHHGTDFSALRQFSREPISHPQTQHSHGTRHPTFWSSPCRSSFSQLALLIALGAVAISGSLYAGYQKPAKTVYGRDGSDCPDAGVQGSSGRSGQRAVLTATAGRPASTPKQKPAKMPAFVFGLWSANGLVTLSPGRHGAGSTIGPPVPEIQRPSGGAARRRRCPNTCAQAGDSARPAGENRWNLTFATQPTASSRSANAKSGRAFRRLAKVCKKDADYLLGSNALPQYRPVECTRPMA